MGAYPTFPRSAFLAWCETHAPIFSANAAAIGLTPGQAAAFAAASGEALEAVVEQGTARTAAKLATDKAEDRLATLRAAAGEATRSIRAFAELQAQPNGVYALSQVPAAAARSPLPPPGQPLNLKATLTAISGALTLRWQCRNPTGAKGTSYIVRRQRVDAAMQRPIDAAWEVIGVTGKKEFMDETLSAGPDGVVYTVQAQRSDRRGPISLGLLVNFGRTEQGGLTAGTSGPAHAAMRRGNGIPQNAAART